MHISNSNDLGSPPYSDHAGRCRIIAVLCGVSLAMLLCGFAATADGVLAIAAQPRLVIAAGLICLAAGPLLPARAAIWLAARRPLILSAALGDAALIWTTLGIFALLAGLATAGLPIWLEQVLAGYRWTVSRFLWPAEAATPLKVAAIVIGLLPAVVPLGVSLSCTHRLAARDCSWCLAPLGWALLGTVGGTWACGLAMAQGLTGRGMIMAGAIPVLVVAALAGHRSGSSTWQRADAALSDAGLPDLRDQSPWMLRFVASWLGVATAILILTWQQIVQAVQPAPGYASATVALLAAAAAAGLLVGERTKAARWPSLGGLGLAANFTGVVVAVGAVLPVIMVPVSLRGDAVRWLAPVMVGAVGAALGGFSFAYGHLAVICRVGSRPATGAALLAAALAGSAVALLVLPDGAAGQRGRFVQLAVLALSLAAVGGLAVIHEPTYSARTRRWRLVTVSACVALMLYGLPLAGRRWASGSTAAGSPSDLANPPSPPPVAVSVALQ